MATRISSLRRAAVAALVLLCARPCVAQHAGDVLIEVEEGRLSIVSRINRGDAREVDVLNDGSIYRTDDPGYNTAAFGVLRTGDEVAFDLVSPLYHWSGHSWAPAESDAHLRFYNPSLPEVDSVVATGASGYTEGFLLQRATTLGTIHVHNIFELTTEGGAPPPEGAYAVGKRLTSPQYDDSDEFFVVLNNGLSDDSFEEGLLAADSTFFPIAGDFDRDGTVSLGDYDAWHVAYGDTVHRPRWSADGNGDTVVDAADYTAWRDAMDATAAAHPAPEPNSLSLLLASLLGVWCFRRGPRSGKIRPRWAAFCSALVCCLAPVGVSHATHLDMMLYQSDGELQLGGYDFGRIQPVFDAQVFQGSASIHPAAPGVARVSNPGWAATPTAQLDLLPPNAGPLPAGAAVAFDIVPSSITGANLSYWDGAGAVAFATPRSGEVVEYGGGLFRNGVLADGSTAIVEGFEFTTTSHTGYLHSHLLFGVFGNSERLPSSSDAPEPGVYLLQIAARVEGLGGSPSAHVLLAVDADDSTLAIAREWVAARVVPEPSSLAVAVLGLSSFVLARVRRA